MGWGVAVPYRRCVSREGGVEFGREGVEGGGWVLSAYIRGVCEQ